MGGEKEQNFKSFLRVRNSMSRKDDYVTKRQLKAIKTRGKRHSSTIVGNMMGIFPEPLVVYSPYPKKHKGERKVLTSDMLEDMTISIDLDVKDVPHGDDFLRMFAAIVGLDRVEKDFEVLSTAEKVIRALAKAKFKNVVTMELDGEEIYHCPEDFYDSSDAIEQLLEELKDPERSGNNITISLLSQDHKDCIVGVKISRLHMTWTHDILITFHGVLAEKYFRRVINYLEDHLEIENIEDEWEKARHFGV